MDIDFAPALVVVRTRPPTAHVTLVGEFDLAEAPRLALDLADVVAAGCCFLRVDLSQVTFCDASTIWLLGKTDERVQADGGNLRVLEASDAALRVLRLAGSDGLVESVRAENVVTLRHRRSLVELMPSPEPSGDPA
ncbi:MAG: STAS domain-containing protein [Nocardioidaceae bacterium]|nr:STAS domain-containing protein [Nocardioidaceae bacterium]